MEAYAGAGETAAPILSRPNARPPPTDHRHARGPSRKAVDREDDPGARTPASLEGHQSEPARQRELPGRAIDRRLLPVTTLSRKKQRGFRVTPTTYAPSMSSVKQNPADLAQVLSELDPAEVLAGVRGVLALCSALNALRDPESPMSRLFGRLGLLADAAFLPDGGTVDVTGLRFLLGGVSDDTVRRMVAHRGVTKHEPTGRGSASYRPGDIARASVVGEPLPETAERRTGVAPPK